MPAASRARSSSAYAPSDRPVSAVGDEHAAHWAPVRRHSNVAEASGEENVNDGAVARVSPDGPPVKAAVGAIVSTIQLRVAGVASVLPAASTARTLKECWPCPRSAWIRGLEQATQLPASRRHS